MKHWYSRILGVMLLGIMLSGCFASQTESKINSDGTGTTVFKMGFDSQYAPLLKSAGNGEDPFAEPKKDAATYPAEWETKVEDWKEKIGDVQYEGIIMTMKFSNLAMMNEQLAKITTDSGSGTSGGPSSSGMLTNMKAEEVNGEFVVTGNANAVDLGKEAEADPSMASYAPELRKALVVWQVTMPGTIKSFEPDTIATKSGNTVTWKIPADKVESYNLKIVSAKSGGGGVGGMSLPLILGIVGGLVVLGGLAYFFMSRKKAAPVATTNYGQYDPNAGYNQQQGGYQQPQGGYQQPYDPNAGYGQQQPYQQNPYDQQNPNDPNRR